MENTSAAAFQEAVASFLKSGRGMKTIFASCAKLCKAIISIIQLFNRTIKQKISIAPERMFTLQNQFENCMRLSIGLPWSEEIRQKLKLLGLIAASMQ